MQHVQYVLLFLVLAVNSDRFVISQSYILLLKPPVFTHPWLNETVLRVCHFILVTNRVLGRPLADGFAPFG